MNPVARFRASRYSGKHKACVKVALPEHLVIVAIPVISSHVLRGLPAFIRSEIGERTLQRANRAAGFDAELIEDRNFYVSQRSVLDFVEAIVRSTGEANLGLLFAPSMNVSDYGVFGSYVFEAETLGRALERSISALRFHSTFDRLSVVLLGDEIRFSYKFALAGSHGYAPAACTAAGELLSLFRAYLPDSWRPLRIELDIPKPTQATLFEDVFQCPVLFNTPAVTIVTERHRMIAPSKRTSRSHLTLADVARSRAGGAPQGVLHVAFEQIRTQVIAGNVSIEDAARSMDTSVRTLQRELNRAGTDFRSLTGSARLERATELLRGSAVSITSISEDLGYSSPTGFSRAFRKATGLGPREFRSLEASPPEADEPEVERAPI